MGVPVLEASLTNRGYPDKGTGGIAPHSKIQPTRNYDVVERWYVELVTPDGFLLKLAYDPDTAREVAKHFQSTKVKARVVLEKVKIMKEVK